MKKKSLILLLLALLLVPVPGKGQAFWKLVRYELGAGLGSIHPFTDIGPANKELLNFFNGSRPNLSVSFSYKLDPLFMLTLNAGYLMFSGADVDASTHFRPDYHWQYSTHSMEHTLRLEYYPLGARGKRTSMALFNRRGMLNHFNTVDFYFFVGAGGLLSKASLYEKDNPANELSGVTGYNGDLLWTPTFPGGAGIKLTWSSFWTFAAEIGYRYYFGDFLDGYSDPYYGDYKDTYYVFNLKAIRRLQTKRNGLPTFRRYDR